VGCAEHGGNRVRKCVGGESLTRNGGRLEERKADERSLEPRSVGGHDPVAVDEKLDRRVVGAARRVSDQFEERHASRLPTQAPGARRENPNAMNPDDARQRVGRPS
jgi:hypothetical protein